MLLLLLPGIINSQWISNYYGVSYGDTPLGDAHGNAVTVDDSGFCYVTGYVDVNNGEGNNILVLKYNPVTGDTLWTATYNGSANAEDMGIGIKADESGNIYVVGKVSNEGKSFDAALLKYSSTGELLWIGYGADFPGADVGEDIAIDGSGNIYVTGFCTKQDLKRYVIINKFSTDGDSLWSHAVIGSDNIEAEGVAIAVNNSGTKVYVTGYMNYDGANKDIFLLGYNTESGDSLFLRNYNGNGSAEDRAFGIAVDAEDYIYITGFTTDSVSGNNCITMKYDTAGTLVWSSIYNGNENSEDRAFGIAVDEDRIVYITGYTTAAAGNINYLTVCYDQDGTEQWASIYDGPAGGEDKAGAIGIINSNSTRCLIVTGSSWGTTQNHDYATIWYDISNGDTLTTSRYSMSATTEDVAKSLAVSPSDGEAYITGFSQLIGNSPSSRCAVSTLKLKKIDGRKLKTNNNIPSGFKLMQNYPNPFNPSTIIKFTISERSNVKMTVYDITGREVNVLINQTLEAGTHEITYAAHDLSSGVYFYEVRAGVYRDVKKMIFVK